MLLGDLYSNILRGIVNCCHSPSDACPSPSSSSNNIKKDKSTQHSAQAHPEVIGMEQSATTFEDPNDRRRKDRRQYMENQGHMILSSNNADVREKYHINAREIGRYTQRD